MIVLIIKNVMGVVEMSKYKSTPWIDKCINAYKGASKEESDYVKTMAVTELVAITKQLQTNPQALNKTNSVQQSAN